VLLGGPGSDVLIGGAGDDLLQGGDGNDILEGGSGDDVLQGSGGNNILDGGAGNDTASYAGAPAGVTVNLGGTSASNGYGGTDILQHIENVVGSGFADTLAGDANNNTLTGNGGNDHCLFGRAGGQDRVVNGVAGAGPSGELDLAGGVATNQLWLAQSGNDLQIDIMGTSDRVTVAGWYGSPAAQLQQITTADGSKLDTQVAQLVQAMASFATNNPGFDRATVAQAPNDATLQAVLATAWHHQDSRARTRLPKASSSEHYHSLISPKPRNN
jgi:Ca2+-binding RTX toxin-like protein